jgi:hypothetical protein
LIQGFQALAVTRSRHFYYNVDHAKVFPDLNDSYDELYNLGWISDGTSDFGRIDRQDDFLRAMVDQAKKLYNPLTLNSFLSKLPQGVTLDQNFTLRELIGLAVRYHGINPNAIATYTLPVEAVNNTSLGDVLFVWQPYAQEQLVDIFGHQLEKPSNPPPDSAMQSVAPPFVAVPTTTSTTTTTVPAHKKKHPGTTTSATTTTTTNPTLVQPNFDPRPCSPS